MPVATVSGCAAPAGQSHHQRLQGNPSAVGAGQRHVRVGVELILTSRARVKRRLENVVGQHERRAQRVLQWLARLDEIGDEVGEQLVKDRRQALP